LEVSAYIFSCNLFHLLAYVLQEKFYNSATNTKSRLEVVDEISDFIVESLGHSYDSAIKSGFNNRNSDLKTRISFKVR